MPRFQSKYNPRYFNHIKNCYFLTPVIYKCKIICHGDYALIMFIHMYLGKFGSLLNFIVCNSMKQHIQPHPVLCEQWCLHGVPSLLFYILVYPRIHKDKDDSRIFPHWCCSTIRITLMNKITTFIGNEFIKFYVL